MSLSGKVAIVTGSGRGLGLAYARELARQGAAVVVNDVDAEVAARRRPDDRGRRRPRRRRRRPGGQLPRPPSSSCRQPSTEFGRLDILVTNAGILRDKSLLKMTRRGLRRRDQRPPARHLHLRPGGLRLLQGARHSPAASSPSAPRPGQRGNFGQTNYAAAKAGIVGMVRTWALEMKKAGVTANAVIPGRRHRHDQDRPVLRRRPSRPTSAARPMPAFFRHDLGFGTADDVAGLIAFLASDAAAGVTGQAIGAGGDRLQLWTHPEAAATEYREGGWGYQDLVENFGALFGGQAAERRRGLPAAAGGTAARTGRGPLSMAATALRTRHRRRRPRCDRHARPPRGGRPRPRVPAGGPDRGLRQVLQGRGPQPFAGPDRRDLPRTEHGRRRLHRRRPDPAQARAQQHPGPHCRARRGTTTS